MIGVFKIIHISVEIKKIIHVDINYTSIHVIYQNITFMKMSYLRTKLKNNRYRTDIVFVNGPPVKILAA